MKVQNNSPAFKAKTTILSHNNILSGEEIAQLKKIGESIGNKEDSIRFNVRNFKKNRIIVTYDAKLNSTKDNISVNGSIMLHKWLLKPAKFIKKIMTGIKNSVNKK